MDPIRLVHNPGNSRYELFVDGELASFTEYHESDGKLVFPHTETRDRFRGAGLAAKVVRYALDDVRERGKTVEATCWFVRDFIEDNAEYRDLLAAA